MNSFVSSIILVTDNIKKKKEKLLLKRKTFKFIENIWKLHKGINQSQNIFKITSNNFGDFSVCCGRNYYFLNYVIIIAKFKFNSQFHQIHLILGIAA